MAIKLINYFNKFLFSLGMPGKKGSSGDVGFPGFPGRKVNKFFIKKYIFLKKKKNNKHNQSNKRRANVEKLVLQDEEVLLQRLAKWITVNQVLTVLTAHPEIQVDRIIITF